MVMHLKQKSMGQDILKGLKAKNIHSIIQKCVLFDRKLSKSSLCWNYFSGMDEHLVTDYITTELGTLFRNFCNKLHYKKLAMKLKALGKAQWWNYFSGCMVIQYIKTLLNKLFRKFSQLSYKLRYKDQLTTVSQKRFRKLSQSRLSLQYNYSIKIS